MQGTVGTLETRVSTTEVLKITKFPVSEEEAGIAFCGHRNWTQTWCESRDAKGHKLTKIFPDLRKSQGWQAAIIPFIFNSALTILELHYNRIFYNHQNSNISWWLWLVFFFLISYFSSEVLHLKSDLQIVFHTDHSMCLLCLFSKPARTEWNHQEYQNYLQNQNYLQSF